MSVNPFPYGPPGLTQTVPIFGPPNHTTDAHQLCRQAYEAIKAERDKLAEDAEYAIREVTGDQVTEDDDVFLSKQFGWEDSGVPAVTYEPRASFIVRKRKPEPTPEQKFREALLAHRFLGDELTNSQREYVIDTAKKEGLL